MRIAYLDCFSGISGDMFLGALVHAGLDPDALRGELSRLGVPGFTLHVERTWRDAMEGVKVDVRIAEDAPRPHRGLSDITTILAGSALDPWVKSRATDVFTRLARAEAKVHGTTEDEVHFHEVGALDAIVDIVGTCAGLRLLEVDEVWSSVVSTGTGFAQCDHGKMPVPVPATLELLCGAPMKPTQMEGELVTPTGAALLTTLSTRIGSVPSLVPSAIGYGFGTRVRENGPPNALRLVLAEEVEASERVCVLETNLDDVSPQVIGFVIDRCLREGALEAFATPAQMKKSRPGFLLTVLADEAKADTLESVLYSETETLGVRRHHVSRSRLERRSETIESSLGEVRVKYARGPGSLRRASPEFDDISRIAAERGIAYREAYETVIRDLPPWPGDLE